MKVIITATTKAYCNMCDMYINGVCDYTGEKKNNNDCCEDFMMSDWYNIKNNFVDDVSFLNQVLVIDDNHKI